MQQKGQLFFFQTRGSAASNDLSPIWLLVRGVTNKNAPFVWLFISRQS